MNLCWNRRLAVGSGVAMYLAAAGACAAQCPPSWGPMTSQPLSGSPGAFATGDFNGDGRTDVAYTAAAPSRVIVLLGNGAGAFVESSSLNTSFTNGAAASFELVVGDFNPAVDGHDDYAVAALPTNGKIDVRFGNGNGTFSAPTTIDYGSPVLITRMRVADLNGDGMDDLVYMYDSGFAVVASNLGTGNGLTPGLSANLSLLPGEAIGTLGRIDPDPRDDLMTLDFGLNAVSVCHQDVDGMFDRYPGSFPTGAGPVAVVASDFNLDQRTDVAVATVSGVRMMFGEDGVITWLTPQPTQPLASASALSVGDVNSDGAPDLVVIRETLDQVSVLLNNGAGVLAELPALTVGDFPIAAAVMHANSDAIPDIVVLNRNSSTLGVLPGLTGVAPAVSAQPVNVQTLSGIPRQMVVAATGDGPLTYQWRRDGVNLGNGGSVSGATTATLTINPVATGDDGQYDAVVTDACGGTVRSACAYLAVTGADCNADGVSDAAQLTLSDVDDCNGNSTPDFCEGQAPIAGYALAFNGTSNHVSVPYTASLNSPSITVECWVFRATSATIDDLVANVTAGTPGSGYGLQINGSGNSTFAVGINPIGEQPLSGPAVPVGAWMHLAGTYDAATFRRTLYVNGVQAATAASAANAMNPNTSRPLLIGAGQTSAGMIVKRFTGMVDEVRVWNVARTAEQIRSNRFRRHTGYENNLVGYWRLDEGLGVTTADLAATGGSSAGTLVSSPVWTSVGLCGLPPPPPCFVDVNLSGGADIGDIFAFLARWFAGCP